MAAELDRLKAGLAGFVRSLFARIDYYALYPAKVIAQNGDGTLELQTDDQRFAGMSGVPIRYGVPGITVTVSPGARVLLGFAGGDPSKPIAELWESASVTELDITATLIKLNGGAIPVAKEGSSTTGHQHTLSGTAGPYALSGTAVLQTDSVASGAGSPTVKVP